MIIFLGQSKGSGDSKNEKKEKEGLHHSPAAAPPSTIAHVWILTI